MKNIYKLIASLVLFLFSFEAAKADGYIHVDGTEKYTKIVGDGSEEGFAVQVRFISSINAGRSHMLVHYEIPASYNFSSCAFAYAVRDSKKSIGVIDGLENWDYSWSLYFMTREDKENGGGCIVLLSSPDNHLLTTIDFIN